LKPHAAIRSTLALLLGAASLLASADLSAQGIAPKAQTDLDRFMARVLERRDENWKKLHDYILSEIERFDLLGPGKVRLNGFRREYSWYVRDRFLIRSPIRFDGVTIAEPERRRYEDRWLIEEQAREAKRDKEKAGQAARPADEAARVMAPEESVPTVEGIAGGRLEPRFVSEGFFLRFKFEPGNYYYVGREQLDGREVVRIEYYPTRLFQDGGHRQEKDRQAAGRDKRADKERERDARIEQGLNKVALVTLWIEPSEFQIVRYTFDNVDFGFLPGRWLFRLDDVSASMTMGKVLDGVWLPRTMSMRAGFSLASGSYQADYGREFYDHKKAEVSARIRSIGGMER